MAAVTYTVQVDWNNDGDYADAYELQPVLDGSGVNIAAGRDQPRQYAPTRVGEATWTANNSDQRFSNALGLIGSNLKPFRPCRVQAKDGATTWTLFTGVVDGWAVKIQKYPLITADFRALDRLTQLASTVLTTALYTGLRTDQAVAVLLDAVGWPVGARSLAVGYTTLGYWWIDGQDALEALQSLATHEGGFFYVNGGGVLVFENRYQRTDVTTDAATLSQISALEYKATVRDVVNRITVKTAPRTLAGARTDVWTANGTVTLAPNEARQFLATSSDPFSGALVPVSGTDFTATAGSVASVSALTRTSGQSTLFTITAGGLGATLTGLKLRAYAVLSGAMASWTAEDTNSQADYGLRALDVAMPYLADSNVARDAAYFLLSRYALPIDAVDVTLRAGTGNSADPQLLKVLGRGIGDRVRVTLAPLGVDWSGFIDSVRHRIRGALQETTFSVEKLRPSDVFTLDSDDYGRLDGAGTLGW